jgi:hypothetical protein
MMKLFVKEFCDRNGLVLKNKRTERRYAYIEVYDTRNRLRSDFLISRNALPKGTLPGDRIDIVKV